MAVDREIWITGIGLLSSLGEGPEIHRKRLYDGDVPVVDTKSFPPYVIHPLAKVDFDRQIPKKGDQRQMEAWQRIGTYAAGLALTDAGVAGNTDLLKKTDMIVAAGGGERDSAVDLALMNEQRGSNDPDVILNDGLMRNLRPTLFLAQLSNLLAGNISIVHGVVGSSRTFMGEESAGISTLQVAQARLAAGQSEIMLVGERVQRRAARLAALSFARRFVPEGRVRSRFRARAPERNCLGVDRRVPRARIRGFTRKLAERARRRGWARSIRRERGDSRAESNPPCPAC